MLAVTCSRNETEHLPPKKSTVRSKKKNTTKKNHKTKATAKATAAAKTKTKAKTTAKDTDKTKATAKKTTKPKVTMNVQVMPGLHGNEQVLFQNSNDKTTTGNPFFRSMRPGILTESNYDDLHKSLNLGMNKKESIVEASRIRDRNTMQIEDFLLEPNKIFEDSNPVAAKAPSLVTKQGTNIDPKSIIDSPPPLLNSNKVLELMKERQRILMAALKRTSASDGTPSATEQMVQDPPTVPGVSVTPNGNKTASINNANITENNVGNFRIDSNFFQDGHELSRNVVVDYASDRSYVYSTDIESKWKLPEFLFLDVPNSTYAARACGQFISNKLIHDLHQKMIQLQNFSAKKFSHKEQILEHIIKTCNKSDYEVENIFVPRAKFNQKHRPTLNTSLWCNDETPVVAINARFRIRYARFGTNIHKMLCHNFMNSQECHRGILVFLPCMQANSPSDRFWGGLEGVQPLPKVDEAISNAKMDKFCMDIAKRHGTFRGKDPEVFGLPVIDRQTNPNANHFELSSEATTTASTASNQGLQQARPKPTKVSVAKKTKKKAVAKKKNSAATKVSLSSIDNDDYFSKVLRNANMNFSVHQI